MTFLASYIQNFIKCFPACILLDKMETANVDNDFATLQSVEIPADISSIQFEVPSETKKAVIITPSGNVIEVY